MADDMKNEKPDEPAPKAGRLSAARAYAAWLIRRKNRAATLNPTTGNVERAPLDSNS